MWCGRAVLKTACTVGETARSCGEIFLRRGEQPPLAWHAFELVSTAVFEAKARARGKVAHRGRREHVAWRGERADARSDDRRDAADLACDLLALARVRPGSDVDAQAAYAIPDGQGAADRTCRTVERRIEAVACGVLLDTTMPLQLAPHDSVMPLNELAPTAVADIRSLLRRSGDVGEEACREEPIDVDGGAASGQELLDLPDDLFLMRDPPKMVAGGKLDKLRAGDVRGEVAAVADVDVTVVDRLDDERRDADRGQHGAKIEECIHPDHLRCPTRRSAPA